MQDAGIFRLFGAAFLVLGVRFIASSLLHLSAEPARLDGARARVQTTLAPLLTAVKSAAGKAVFIRIIKAENLLEVWIAGNAKNAFFQLLKSYPIYTFFGELGPKTKEGDMQAPQVPHPAP